LKEINNQDIMTRLNQFVDLVNFDIDIV